MARPSKPVAFLHECSQTKDELNKRLKYENKLKGNTDNIKAPPHLSKRQSEIFETIEKGLKDSEVLSNLDVPLLSLTSATIGYLWELDSIINNVQDNTDDKIEKYNVDIQRLLNIRKNLTSDFFRCANELGLSPQSRAKIANNKMMNTEDELLKILKDE